MTNLNLQVGDEVVVRTNKRYFRATVTELWNDKEGESRFGMVEIEYDNLFAINVREIVSMLDIYGVKPRDKKG